MTPTTLDDWLQWLEGVHPQEIDLGLVRIREVAARMGLGDGGMPIITVAGTNGKGSTVACLEAMFLAAGHRPGLYTSPHLLSFNERIRIAGRPVDDARIINAFEAINAARGDTTLTYFEFATLAAAFCFHAANASPWILEVGLGGRLDATNCFDADVAVVTRIDLDHMEWLGDNREAIAGEKMGITRAGRPVVCCDSQPPERIAQMAHAQGSPLWQLGQDYHCLSDHSDWTWRAEDQSLEHLPRPAWMADAVLTNAAGAVTVVAAGLHPLLSLDAEAIRTGLATASLAGRQQLVSAARGRWMLDVGHNPSAIDQLARRLAAERGHGKVRIAFALMLRKPLLPLIDQLMPVVDEWFVLDLDDPALHPVAEVQAVLKAQGAQVMGQGDAKAARFALEQGAENDDLMVAAGSFRVVECFMRLGIGACNNQGSGRN